MDKKLLDRLEILKQVLMDENNSWKWTGEKSLIAYGADDENLVCTAYEVDESDGQKWLYAHDIRKEGCIHTGWTCLGQL